MTKPETTGEADTTPKDAATLAGITDDVDLGHDEGPPTAGTERQPDTGEETPPPDGETEPDFSFLSDDIQNALKENPNLTAAEFIAAHRDPLQRGYLRRDKFSRDKNALREEQDRLAEAIEKSSRYDSILSDKRKRDRILQIIQEEPEAADADDKLELPEEAEFWTPVQTLQFMEERNRRRDKALVEAVKRQTRDEVMRELNAPSERLGELNAGAAKFMDDNDVPEAVMTAACAAIKGDSELFSSLTPGLLPGVLKMAVRQVEASMSLEEIRGVRESTQKKVVGAGAASPKGQTGAAAPDHRTFKEKNGRPMSADDFMDKWYAAKGIKESDLDKALFRRP